MTALPIPLDLLNNLDPWSRDSERSCESTFLACKWGPDMVDVLRELRKLAQDSLGSASAATDLAILRDAVLRLTGGSE